jgi:hypothetical protein
MHCCESLRNSSRETGKIDYEKASVLSLILSTFYCKDLILEAICYPCFFYEGLKLGMFSVSVG